MQQGPPINPNTPSQNPSPQPASTNAMLRPCYLTVVVGKKFCGKTYRTLEVIKQYVTVLKRKVLIFDANDEFQQIKAISIKDIKKFSNSNVPEVRRVRPYREDGTGNAMTLDEMCDTLSLILGNYRKGMLLLEDISKYVADTYKKDLLGMIATLRHMEVDTYIHFQTIGKMGFPKIFGNTNIIRLHQTGDSVSMHEDKFKGEIYQLLLLAESLVEYKCQTNIRFCCYINKDERKMSGNFSKQDFTAAIRKYISENPKIVKTEMARLDFDGNKVNQNYATAARSVEKKMWYYYGNPQ